jgi:hypothetical protein
MGGSTMAEERVLFVGPDDIRVLEQTEKMAEGISLSARDEEGNLALLNCNAKQRASFNTLRDAINRNNGNVALRVTIPGDLPPVKEAELVLKSGEVLTTPVFRLSHGQFRVAVKELNVVMEEEW